MTGVKTISVARLRTRKTRSRAQSLTTPGRFLENSQVSSGIHVIMKIVLSVALCFLVSLSGCSPKESSPEAVREHAANATAELKQDTKALAQGVREGWTRDSSVDLNSASKEQLETLPGVTSKTAESIVAHRPYAKSSELVDRHILSKAEYGKIADRLKVTH